MKNSKYMMAAIQSIVAWVLSPDIHLC